MGQKFGICAGAGLLIVLLLGLPHVARAEGALAVGSTGDINKDGIAYGVTVNAATRADARASALKTCRGFRAKRAAAKCRVVATFRRECGAIANDPKDGTPGTGWAVAATREAAIERALAACQTTEGPGRQGACVVNPISCDTND